MYQRQITEKEAGQRFDKYLHKLLPAAQDSFLRRMLRKKNITLNGKKADGSERIAVKDTVEIFFSEDTLAKFMEKKPMGGTESGRESVNHRAGNIQGYYDAFQKFSNVKVIYENQHMLLADKPAGVLSQKAKPTDLSLNEWLIGYLLQNGSITEEELSAYKPSICNRLDRNTGGIVLCAKSVKGAQVLGELLQGRTLHKYYLLYVKGRVAEEQLIEGYLYKDERRNKVSIRLTEEDASAKEGEAYIKTRYKPVRAESDKTLLEVELITGKPHQIRAHLAGVGHPLLGDYKYGDRAWNDFYQEKYHVKSQLLYAYKIVFPRLDTPFEDVSEKTFCVKLPDVFDRVSQ